MTSYSDVIYQVVLMMVVGGSAGCGLDKGIAKLLGAELVNSERKDFPDGEFKVLIPKNAGGHDVVIVQSTYAPQEKNLFELLLIADTLKQMNAKSITAVVPYLAYARQNKMFESGESVSIRTILRMLASVGVKTLITVEPHKKEPLMEFGGTVKIINSITALAEAVKSRTSKPFVLAPDAGGIDMAKKAALVLKCEYTYLEKDRDRVTGDVTIKKAPEVNFTGKDVVIFDDMISTGGTIAQTAKFAKARGAKTVVAAAAHLLMMGDAYEKLRASGISELFGTNTVPYENARMVDISREIADAIKK